MVVARKIITRPHYATKFSMPQLAEKLKTKVVKYDSVDGKCEGIKVAEKNGRGVYIVIHDERLYIDYIYDYRYVNELEVEEYGLGKFAYWVEGNVGEVEFIQL